MVPSHVSEHGAKPGGATDPALMLLSMSASFVPLTDPRCYYKSAIKYRW